MEWYDKYPVISEYKFELPNFDTVIYDLSFVGNVMIEYFRKIISKENKNVYFNERFVIFNLDIQWDIPQKVILYTEQEDLFEYVVSKLGKNSSLILATPINQIYISLTKRFQNDNTIYREIHCVDMKQYKRWYQIFSEDPLPRTFIPMDIPTIQDFTEKKAIKCVLEIISGRTIWSAKGYPLMNYIQKSGIELDDEGIFMVQDILERMFFLWDRDINSLEISYKDFSMKSDNLNLIILKHITDLDPKCSGLKPFYPGFKMTYTYKVVESKDI